MILELTLSLEKKSDWLAVVLLPGIPIALYLVCTTIQKKERKTKKKKKKKIDTFKYNRKL